MLLNISDTEGTDGGCCGSEVLMLYSGQPTFSLDSTRIISTIQFSWSQYLVHIYSPDLVQFLPTIISSLVQL